MANVLRSNFSSDIDSAAQFLSSYQVFTKSVQDTILPQQPPPESYKILSRRSPLLKFPSNFPAAKRIPGTRCVVDGFRSAGAHSVTYFLTHFHADHYAGLNPHWSRGLIFCSDVTARLLVNCLKIPPAFVVSVAVGEPLQIDNYEVTLIDANHCPGAVQILARVYADSGEVQRYVHTGDMRYSSDMTLDPALCDFIGADAVFLDTTYCNPKFVFPSQTESVEYIVNTVHRIITEENFKSHNKTSVLFLIAAYVVGKERILTAVARRCDCPVYVDERKMAILNCLELEDCDGVFTTHAGATNVHVVGWNVLGETWPYFRPNWSNIEKIMKDKGYSRVVGFVPTGWLYEVKNYSFPVRVKGCFEVHLVPYSEHSNYNELREYVRFLRPKEIIPTVGLEGLGLDSKQVASMRKCFANLVDEMAQKKRFLKGFKRRAVTTEPIEDKDDVDQEGTDEKFGIGMEADQECNKAVKSALPNKNVMEIRNKDVRISQVKSTTDGGAQTAVIHSSPRAFFGKGARKKGENQHVLSSIDIGNSLHDSANQSGGLDSVAVLKNNDSDASQNARNEIGGVIDDPGCCAAGSVSGMEEAIEELRICLPDWVTEDQMMSLLTRTQGDITAAVSEFYDHEMEFWEQIVTITKANPPDSDLPISEISASDKLFKQPPSVSNAAMTSTQGTSLRMARGTSSRMALKSVGFNVPDAYPSTANQHNKTSSKRNAGSKVYDRSIGSKPKKKPKWSVKSVPSKSKQFPITNFFRKGDGGVPGMYPVPKQSSITNFFKKEVMGGGVSNVDSVITSSECAVKCSGGSQSICLEQVYGESLSQLLQILDGSVSEEDALILLEKAKGDVSVALDMYYNACGEQSAKQTRKNKQSSDDGIFPLVRGSDHPNCNSGENKSYDAAAPTTMSIQRLSETSAVDVNGCSVGLALEKYNPVEHVCWHAEESAPYLHLARTFDLVEQESGKLKTTVMLCNMFRSLLALSPKDVLPAVYLCTNRIAPDYENVDLNIGGSTVLAAIEEAFGTPKTKLRDMYNTVGDLGDVAQACRQTQSMLVVPQALSIGQVFSALQQISKERGSGSNARKKGVILSLLRSCREKETKFLVRTLVRNMRIGAMMRTVLPALAQAVTLNSSALCLGGLSDKLRAQLQRASVAAMEAYNVLPNLNMLIPTMISKGINFLSTTVSISPGVPIKPMLAKITNGVPEVFKCMEGKAFTCEYKYDGQRAQVHMLIDGSIRIFSRNCEDSTSRFPDVVDTVLSLVKSTTKSFVLDAEVVAVDRQNGNKIMAFQYLSSRERGRNGSSIQSQNIKVDVCIFIFDLMFVNGEQLVAFPLRERRKRIKELFSNEKLGYLEFANEITVESDEAHPSIKLAISKVDAFLAEAISCSCEGIMVKVLDANSEYAPSKRSDSWLKVKRDYVEGLHETLDLVPIGAWHGNGRKAGWFSPFLLACYNPDSEEYQSVCRVMSGFSDAFYKEMEEFFSGERILTKKPAYYQTLEEPDVWFAPELIWEIRGADLTVSPVHRAAVGLVHPSRGISMRFPRFIRQRIDKNAEDSSTSFDIADLFHRQTRKLDFSIDGQKS